MHPHLPVLNLFSSVCLHCLQYFETQFGACAVHGAETQLRLHMKNFIH